MTVRLFRFVRCVGCGHVWDEENPDDDVCGCFDRDGHRAVTVVSEGATNLPRAARQPLHVDISDYSDEFCAGFLAGQVNALNEVEQILAHDGLYLVDAWLGAAEDA